MEERFEIPTPFGKVRLPGIEDVLPKFPPKMPRIDERRNVAMRHAVAIDLSSIVAFIPIVGDVVADVVEDLHGAELRRILTREEMDEFEKQDKVAPSTIALIRTFMRIP